jgi:hypothetical protein
MGDITYIDKASKARTILLNARMDTLYIAEAFEATGNSKIADDLKILCNAIEAGTELYNQAFSELFNSGIESTNTLTKVMMESIFAGISIGKEK